MLSIFYSSFPMSDLGILKVWWEQLKGEYAPIKSWQKRAGYFKSYPNLAEALNRNTIFYLKK